MPVVPTQDNFRAAPTAGGVTPAQTNFNAEAATGQQLEQVGNQAAYAGRAVGSIALDAQDQVNQTRVNEAVNQARQAVQNLTYDPQVGYQAQKGAAALQRESGQALPDEYGAKLQSALSDISGSLGNDRQKLLFQQTAQNIGTQFRGDVQNHMLGEYKNYNLSVQDGTINLASNDAKTAWNDPDKINAAVMAAKAAVVEKGRELGWAPVATEAALLQTTSSVHKDVIMSALENNNPNYALGYMNQNKDSMSADDILRVQGHINQQVWANQSMQAVQSATTAFQPKVAPNDFDRMTQITLASESGGKRYGPDGKTLLTSPAGAQGEMQVMPGTKTDPGFGVKPAQNNSPDELARVGRDYLQAMLQRYGDPAKAWAAYNAGPGTLDKALKEAATDAPQYRGAVPADAWLAKMPAETQAYVAKNVAQLGSAYTPPKPVESDFVSAALDKLPPGAAPQVVNMTRTAAVTQFGIITKSLAEQGDNAVKTAQQWVTQNTGTPIDQMPASIRDGVVRYAPDKFVELEKLSKAMQRGDVTTDLTLYNRLTSHPEALTGMTDTQFEMLKASLAPADFKHFSKDRQDLLSGTTDDTSGGINAKAVSTSLNTRLETIGINVSPKPTDSAGRERIGGIQQFVRNSIFDAQQQAGRKFTPAEIDQHIDGLFATNATFKSSFMGTGWFSSTSQQPVLGMQAADIPADQLKIINDSYAQRGVLKPTPTQQINAYRTWKTRQN